MSWLAVSRRYVSGVSGRRDVVSSRDEVQPLTGSGGEGEALVDAVTDDPGDLVAHAHDRNTVAVPGGEFGVDEDILQLLFAAEAEGTETISGAAPADSQARASLGDIEISFVRTHLADLSWHADDFGEDGPASGVCVPRHAKRRLPDFAPSRSGAAMDDQ